MIKSVPKKRSKLTTRRKMQSLRVQLVKWSGTLKGITKRLNISAYVRMGPRIIYLGMGKVCIIAGLFLLSMNFVHAQNYDFRKVNWGMNYNQVKNSELPRTGIISEGRLVYKDTIAGTLYTLVYTFNEKSELVSAKYILDEKYFDNNFYTIEYGKFKALLTKKYGTPVKDFLNWTSEASDKDSTNWANALESGYLQLTAQWKVPKTIITLQASKYETVHIIISYISRNLKNYDISKYSTNDL